MMNGFTLYYDSLIGSFVIERNFVRYGLFDNPADAVARLKEITCE